MAAEKSTSPGKSITFSQNFPGAHLLFSTATYFLCVPCHQIHVLLLRGNGAERGVPIHTASEDIKLNCSLKFLLKPSTCRQLLTMLSIIIHQKVLLFYICTAHVDLIMPPEPILLPHFLSILFKYVLSK